MLKYLTLFFALLFPFVLEAAPLPVATLFTSQTTNGNSSVYTFNVNTGTAQAMIDGTWGSATMTLYYSRDDGATWVAYSSGSCTANCSYSFRESFGMQVRATQSGSTGPTNLNVNIYKYPQ